MALSLSENLFLMNPFQRKANSSFRLMQYPSQQQVQLFLSHGHIHSRALGKPDSYCKWPGRQSYTRVFSLFWNQDPRGGYQFFKVMFSTSEKQTKGFNLGTHSINTWKTYPGTYICLQEMCMTLALNQEHHQLKLSFTERFLDAFQHKVLFHLSTSSQPVEQPTEELKNLTVT